MIGGKCHVCLHEFVDGGSLWYDPAEKFMVVLALSFLIGAVWFTEKDVSTLHAINRSFQPFNI